MFDAVRNNKKIVQVFLALITLPFALWGVDSYVRGSDPGKQLVTVGETKITQQDFQDAWREQVDTARRQQGESFRLDAFDTPETRTAVLNSLIDRRLLTLEAQQARLGVSDTALMQYIVEIPVFQVDGQFSKERYESFLKAQGMDPARFEARLRQDLLIQQFAASIGGSQIVAAHSAEQILRLQSEERQVAEWRIAPDQFLAETKVSAEAVQKFYDENQKQFRVLESVRAEYVVFSVDNLLNQVEVSEADVKKFSDERRASHILVALTPGADKAQARGQAEEILKEVKSSPEKFAEIARKRSQDPGSAGQDGDLGFFAHGMMVPSFDEAVFSLKQGEISDLVESEFGFHIIKLTGIRPPKPETLGEIRARVKRELALPVAQKRYKESAEDFTNMVYQESDSLAAVAEKYKLKIEHSPLLTKDMPPMVLQSLGPLGNQKLIAELFSDDVVKSRHNTKAIEVAPGVLIAARVAEHTPAALKSFDEVRQDVENRLKAREAAVMASTQGQAALAELKEGKIDGMAKTAKWTSAKPVTLQQRGASLPQPALRAIFGADIEKLPVYTGVELPGNAGYAVYKITAVKPLEKLDANVLQQVKQGLGGLVAREDFTAYLSGLRKRHEVKVNWTALEETTK